MSKSAADWLDVLDEELGTENATDRHFGFLDTGLANFNKALSGGYKRGFVQGKMIEVFGPPSSGKTYLATLAMKACQNKGGIAFFADHERSFEPYFAQKLGLNLDNSVFRHIRPETFEKSVDTMIATVVKLRESGMPMEIPLIWVFDSLAAMVPHAKLYDDKGRRRKSEDYNMRDKLLLASCTSQSFPAVKQIAFDYNCTVIFLNQTGKNPGVMFGDPTVAKGGDAPKFYCDTRISLNKKEVFEGKGSDREILGFDVTATMVKNKLTRPLTTTVFHMRHTDLTTEVDVESTMTEYAVLKGMIVKNGTRIEWGGKKLYQKQLVDLFKEKPDEFEKLLALLPDDEELTTNEIEKLGLTV